MTDQRAYYRAEGGNWCEYYDMLKGPDDFECLLTEPEDRNWWRDGREVVTRLNEQHDEIASLTARLAAAEARLRKYEPEPGKCEHGVAEGDWCEPCNREYKAAAEDEAAKGGRDGHASS